MTKAEAQGAHPETPWGALCYVPQARVEYHWPAKHTAFPMAVSAFCLMFIAVLTIWLWLKARRILRAYD